jgi:hypothetical protein
MVDRKLEGRLEGERRLEDACHVDGGRGMLFRGDLERAAKLAG